MEVKLLTILFTDIEASTELIERLGDFEAHSLLISHNKIIDQSIKNCGGRPVKYLGDGVMAIFRTASSAVNCATDIQKKIEAHNRTKTDKVSVRIGINAGEPMVIEGDLFGIAVQAAARICNYANGGEIVVSAVVKSWWRANSSLSQRLGR